MAMQDLTAEEVTAIVREHVPNWADYETEDDCIADNIDILFEHLWEGEDEPLEDYDFDDIEDEFIDEQRNPRNHQRFLRYRRHRRRYHLGLQVHLVPQLYYLENLCLGMGDSHP